MEEIGKHISELLFDHDCVIVPALGGFLASNQPSRIVLPNHIIFPPYRRIAFNVYLKQNDGLLANHIVESTGIAYVDAIQLINSFTSSCFENLDAGKKVNITDIGTLFYDKEKNIQFEAVRNFNHLKDSFGLESVSSLPVVRMEQPEKKRPLPEKKLRPSIASPKTERTKPKLVISKGKRYFGVAAIVAVMVWLSLNLYLIAPKHYESTSLNPFDSQETILKKTDSIRNTPSKTIEQKSDTVAIVVPADTNSNTAVVEKEENNGPAEVPVVKKEITEIPKESPKPEVKVEVKDLSYHNYLIAGVFKVRENAESLLLHLKQSGFTDACIIEENDRNYVSYKGFNNYNDAIALADSLKQRDFEGWVWKH